MPGATNARDGACLAEANRVINEVSVPRDSSAAGRALEWAVGMDEAWPKALSLIAHELRSPAAVISGYLRLLLQTDAEELSERQRRILSEASSSCAQILRLAHELGELASLEDRDRTRELSRVAFFSLCDDVIAASRREDGPPCSFSCSETDRPAMVNGDPPRLRRAVSALVAAMARERGDKPLEGYGFIDPDGSASHVVLALGGPGLASQRQSILDKRTPLDPWQGGTGLSVPIACRIIEAYDGRLWSGGVGEPIVCSLPLAASE